MDLFEDTNGEKYRYECEVRYLLKYRQENGLQGFQEYLRNSKFGPRLAKLKSDIADQWAKGNRGEKGDWR